MATSIDVAQYIYCKQGWVDTWKLAKLTYYAQTWSLGWYGKPLFDEEFQAWADGSVEPKLHAKNHYGRAGMTSTTLPSADLSRLTEEDTALINAVLEFYGGLSTQDLIDRTHSELPWIEARAGLKAGERSRKPLPQSTMRRFYAIQDLEGFNVPRPPKIALRSNRVETREKLNGAVKRWRTALDLLANR